MLSPSRVWWKLPVVLAFSFLVAITFVLVRPSVTTTFIPWRNADATPFPAGPRRAGPPSVLVLGSGGLVGRSLSATLAAKHYSVTEVRNRHELDLRDVGALEGRFEANTFSFCFFLAFESEGSTPLGMRHVYNTAVASTNQIYSQVFPFLKKHAIPTLFISSQQVQGDTIDGSLKAHGEKLAQDLPAGRTVRLPIVFGMDVGGGFTSNIITDALWGCLQHGRFQVATDGHENRQFIHTDDLAQALVSAMEHFDSLPQVSSITPKSFHTIQDVMAQVQAATGDCDILYSNVPAQVQSMGEHNTSMIFQPPNVAYRSLKQGVQTVADTLRSNIDAWINPSRAPLLSLVVFGDDKTHWDSFVHWLGLWHNSTSGMLLEEEVLTTFSPPNSQAHGEACALASSPKRTASVILEPGLAGGLALNAVAQRAQSDVLVLWNASIPPTRALAQFLWKKMLRTDAVYFAQKGSTMPPAPRVAYYPRSSWFSSPHNSVCEGFMVVPKTTFLKAGGLPAGAPHFASFALGLSTQLNMARVMLDVPFDSCATANPEWQGPALVAGTDQPTQPIIMSCPQRLCNHTTRLDGLPGHDQQPLASNLLGANSGNGLGTHANWPQLPTVDVVCKTYIGSWDKELLPGLIMSFLLFWPQDYGKLVLVLDHEVEQEHFAGAILEQLSPQIVVVYENLTVDPGTIFLGKDYEARPGYDRQQMMRFYGDLYTQADYVALMDADASFISAVTPSNLFAPDGRPLAGAAYHHRGYYSKSTEAALGIPYSDVDGMTRFPMVIKRQHFKACRDRIQKTLGTSSFPAAFRKLLDVGKISENTIISNCLWQFHRAEYDWHIQLEHLQPGRPLPDWVTAHPEYLTPMQHITNHKVIKQGYMDMLSNHDFKQAYCLTVSNMGLQKPFCKEVDTSVLGSLTHFQLAGDFSAPFVSSTVNATVLTEQQKQFMKAVGSRLRQPPGPEVIVNIPPL